MERWLLLNLKRKKEKRKNDVLRSFIAGIIIGIGFIIPGVSGGILAVLLGVYDKIIYSISNFKKDILKNSGFLFVVLSGILIGSILFSNVLIYLLETREFAIKYIFMGLIIGGLPTLLKEIKEKDNKRLNIRYLIIALLFSIGLFVIEKTQLLKFDSDNLTMLNLIVAGLFYSSGKIIPGISGAALLMLLGIYEYLLGILANPLSLSFNEIIKLLPFFISFIISSYILVKVINYLLKKHYNKTYSAILGFVIGSLLFIFPGFTFNIRGLLGITLLMLSTIFVYLFEKISEK